VKHIKLFEEFKNDFLLNENVTLKNAGKELEMGVELKKSFPRIADFRGTKFENFLINYFKINGQSLSPTNEGGKTSAFSDVVEAGSNTYYSVKWSSSPTLNQIASGNMKDVTPAKAISQLVLKGEGKHSRALSKMEDMAALKKYVADQGGPVNANWGIIGGYASEVGEDIALKFYLSNVLSGQEVYDKLIEAIPTFKGSFNDQMNKRLGGLLVSRVFDDAGTQTITLTSGDEAIRNMKKDIEKLAIEPLFTKPQNLINTVEDLPTALSKYL
jgi:hypothetical protein